MKKLNLLLLLVFLTVSTVSMQACTDANDDKLTGPTRAELSEPGLDGLECDCPNNGGECINNGNCPNGGECPKDGSCINAGQCPNNGQCQNNGNCTNGGDCPKDGLGNKNQGNGGGNCGNNSGGNGNGSGMGNGGSCRR